MEHTLVVLAENNPGVLSKVAGLFSSRGFNIDSLTVGETLDPTVSRMTIVVRGDDRILEQVNKQLNKLIDTIKVQDMEPERTVERELVLVRVACTPARRVEVLALAQAFRATVMDVAPSSLIIEATGARRKLQALVEVLTPYGIQELARTGRVAMTRGKSG